MGLKEELPTSLHRMSKFSSETEMQVPRERDMEPSFELGCAGDILDVSFDSQTLAPPKSVFKLLYHFQVKILRQS